MSYQRDREEFIATVTAEGMPLDAARLVLRDAATVQRFEIDALNRPTTDAERKRATTAARRIADRCAAHGMRADIGGDARGRVVKIHLPSGRWNSLGGPEDGWTVPARVR